MKRTAFKKVSTEARILRFMRLSRAISMRDAGSRCGISDSAINHYEQGRMDLFPARVAQLVHAYGYTMTDFEEYIEGKDIPLPSLRSECISLINSMDEFKLRTIHPILATFASGVGQ